MTAYLLDTDTISYAVRGMGNVRGHLARHPPSTLAVSSVTMMEIEFGLAQAPARRAAVEQLQESDWEFTPSDLPGMLDYARALWGGWAGVRLGLLAEKESRKAAQIREAYREAQATESDALALAALPPAEVLEKITRYEAHLERVLYRALHDLEASRRDREGKESPPPLRGVLDAQGEP